MIKQNMKHFNRLFVILDMMLIGLSLIISWYIRFKSGLLPIDSGYLSFREYMRVIVLVLPTYLILYNFFNLYSPHRTKSLIDELGNILKANLIGILGFITYLYIFNNIHYSRWVIILFFLITITLCYIERILLRIMLRKYRKSNKNLRHIVLVGLSDLSIEYSKKIQINRHWGYVIEGMFDEYVNRNFINLYKKTVPVLGKIKDIEGYLQTHDIDEVVITLNLKDYIHLENTVEICEKQGVLTRIIPDYYKVIPTRPYIEDIDGLPMISIRKIPLNDVVNKTVKRGIDIVVSLFGLIILSPFFLVISLIIKSEGKGPIIYKQTRIGLNRTEFVMYKFRSMVPQKKKQEKIAWTTKDDPRVTKFGRFIRKTSIDEFPQLINVLKGDMSLIGPRPERPQFVEKFKEEIPKYMVKHQVRPGMTGWAQVHGWRGDTSIKKRIEYDLYYIENWSLKLDIKILLMTFFKGFFNTNAY
jgi:Undecaprenyl-phosphate glucose phosphotransferase